MSRGQGVESDGAERVFDKSMLGLGRGVDCAFATFFLAFFMLCD